MAVWGYGGFPKLGVPQGVEGLGFRVQGLGSLIWGLEPYILNPKP